MVKRIRAEIKASPITWKGKKVQPHQDNEKTFDELSSWEEAKDIADKIAKKTLGSSARKS